MSRRSRSADNNFDAFDAYEDVDAAYVTPAPAQTERKKPAAARKPASSPRKSSAATTSRKSSATATRSPRRTSDDVFAVPDILDEGGDYSPVVPSIMDEYADDDRDGAIAEAVEEILSPATSGGGSGAPELSMLAPLVGAAASPLSSASGLIGSLVAGSAASKIVRSGAEVAEAASPKSSSPLLAAASPDRPVSPRRVSAAKSRLAAAADSIAASPTLSKAIGKFSEATTSGAPLRSPRITDVPVPGLTTPLANTPLAAASLTGAVKPTTQVSATPQAASRASAAKSSLLARLSPRRGEAQSPDAAAQSPAAAARSHQLSPRLEAFARSLSLSKPAVRPPSPVRTPARAEPAPEVTIRTATEIIEDLGMTPLRAVVTRDDGEESRDVARYILAVTDVNNGRFTSCRTGRELSKKSASPCMPLTVLVALDTENRPAAGAPSASYRARPESVTRISKAAFASRSLETPREARVLLLSPQLSGVCAFSGDLSRFSTARRSAEADDIEVGEFVKVEDSERGGAMSGVEVVAGGTRLGTAGVAPIVPLSSLIRNPSRAVEEIVETTQIIKRRAKEIDADLVRWYHSSLAAKEKRIRNSLAEQQKRVQAGIVSYGKLLAATESAVDDSLCRLNGFLRAYDRAREEDREFTATDEIKFATVIGNIEKFAGVRADLPNITNLYMQTLDEYSGTLDNMLSTVNEPLAQMVSDMDKIYMLLKTHLSVAGYDLISTGQE